MCIEEVLPIYLSNISTCICTYSTYCIILCLEYSHNRSKWVQIIWEDSVIPRDWQLEWVRAAVQFRTKELTKKTKLIIRPPQAKCIRTDRHTDSQKQGDHWLSGETQKLRHDCTRGGNRREEWERKLRFWNKREKEFKGLREQMANCTRVSQPGSKSVLCIGMGEGGVEGGRGKQEKGRGHEGSWGGAIRPWEHATGQH